MAKPLDCSHCNKPSTIHLTQIVDNQIKKLDFCEDCPHQKGMTDPSGLSLAGLLSDSGIESTEMPNPHQHLKCAECGTTPEEFKKTGRFGCPACYQYLEPFISPLLIGMHKGSQHCGKAPNGMLQRIRDNQELDDLREQLIEAVRSERFEDAARYRDELKQREEQIDEQ